MHSSPHSLPASGRGSPRYSDFPIQLHGSSSFSNSPFIVTFGDEILLSRQGLQPNSTAIVRFVGIIRNEIYFGVEFKPKHLLSNSRNSSDSIISSSNARARQYRSINKQSSRRRSRPSDISHFLCNGIFNNIQYFHCAFQQGLLVQKAHIASVVNKNELLPRVTVGDTITVLSLLCDGIIKYIGTPNYKNASKNKTVYFGVELFERRGNCNGSLCGQTFFYCRKKYGVFVTKNEITCSALNDVEKEISYEILSFTKYLLNQIENNLFWKRSGNNFKHLLKGDRNRMKKHKTHILSKLKTVTYDIENNLCKNHSRRWGSTTTSTTLMSELLILSRNQSTNDKKTDKKTDKKQNESKPKVKKKKSKNKKKIKNASKSKPKNTNKTSISGFSKIFAEQLDIDSQSSILKISSARSSLLQLPNEMLMSNNSHSQGSNYYSFLYKNLIYDSLEPSDTEKEEMDDEKESMFHYDILFEDVEEEKEVEEIPHLRSISMDNKYEILNQIVSSKEGDHMGNLLHASLLTIICIANKVLYHILYVTFSCCFDFRNDGEIQIASLSNIK